MKKIIIGIIIGILISSVAYAAVSLSSDKVGYNDTTVKDSLDSLFTEAVNGKNSITTALSNKGFNVNNNSTYSEIINGINELPVMLSKDEKGDIGYIKDGNFISFNSDVESVKIIQDSIGTFTASEEGVYAVVVYAVYCGTWNSDRTYCSLSSTGTALTPIRTLVNVRQQFYGGTIYTGIYKLEAGQTITAGGSGNTSYGTYGAVIYKIG